MELFNPTFERTILASLLFSEDINAFEDRLELLEATYFYMPEYGDIFNAIVTLNNSRKPTDEEFIKTYLERAGKFNERALLEVISTTPVANIEPYAKELKELQSRRSLLQLGIEIRKKVEGGESADAIEHFVEIALLQGGATANAEPLSMAQSIAALETMVMPPKIPLGIPAVDRVLCGGIEPSQLVHIGGEQNVGKTTLTRQILCNVSTQYKSLFFSFEMPAWKIAKTLKHRDNFNANNFFIIDRQSMSTDVLDVAKMIRRWHRKQNIRFVLIDSKMKLQNASFKGSDVDRVGNIDSVLSAVATELDIVIMLITQLSKEDQKNRVMTSYGSILSDYETDMKILLTKEEANKIGLEVKKNRQEVLFEKVPLWFDKDKLEFSDTLVPTYESQIYASPQAFGGNSKVTVTQAKKAQSNEREAVSMPTFL